MRERSFSSACLTFEPESHPANGEIDLMHMGLSCQNQVGDTVFHQVYWGMVSLVVREVVAQNALRAHRVPSWSAEEIRKDEFVANILIGYYYIDTTRNHRKGQRLFVCAAPFAQFPTADRCTAMGQSQRSFFWQRYQALQL